MVSINLGKIADIITGPFGSMLHKSDYRETGTPVIMPQDIGDRTLSLENIARIGQRDAERLARYATVENDIVYARRGDVEKHAFITADEAGALCGTGCLRVRVDERKADPLFVSFYLNRPESRMWIRLHAVGSNMPNINTDILSELPMELPDLEAQRKVGSLLRRVDAKIANNKKLMAELEEVARLIYDYWFTQFDFPDKNGKPYRSSGGKMLWNDVLKREIPAMWHGGCLSDIISVTMGQSPTGESYNETGNGDVFYQGRVDFGAHFPVARVYTSAPTRHAKADDVLLSVRAPVGDMNYAYENCCIGRGLASLRGITPSPLFTRFTLESFTPVFKRMNGNGTTFGAIDKDGLNGLPVVVPSSETIEGFENIVGATYARLRVAETETRNLVSLRNWLLPMLMNGQLSVE